MQNGQLGKSFRLSSGPLYSKRELANTEFFLAQMGLTKTEDNPTLGFRVYSSPEGNKGSAVVYLDHVGAHPNDSGTMIVSKADGQTDMTTVWQFSKQQSIAATKNPVVRKIRQALNI